MLSKKKKEKSEYSELQVITYHLVSTYKIYAKKDNMIKCEQAFIFENIKVKFIERRNACSSTRSILHGRTTFRIKT